MQIDTKGVLRRIELRLTEIDMEKGEFYNKSGISSGSYSQWNTEAHQPSLKKLRAAASVLGVSLEYLLYGDEAEKEKAPDPKTEGVSPTVQELFDFIDTATDNELDELLRYAQFLMSKR
jgi:transcriptional regulator with XRE-family HTH domain